MSALTRRELHRAVFGDSTKTSVCMSLPVCPCNNFCLRAYVATYFCTMSSALSTPPTFWMARLPTLSSQVANWTSTLSLKCVCVSFSSTLGTNRGQVSMAKNSNKKGFVVTFYNTMSVCRVWPRCSSITWSSSRRLIWVSEHVKTRLRFLNPYWTPNQTVVRRVHDQPRRNRWSLSLATAP